MAFVTLLIGWIAVLVSITHVIETDSLGPGLIGGMVGAALLISSEIENIFLFLKGDNTNDQD